MVGDLTGAVTGEGRAFVSGPGGEWVEVGHVTSVQLRASDGRLDELPLGRCLSEVKVTLPLPGGLAAFVDAAGISIYGVLRICEACRAPAVDPFPDGWRMGIHIGPGSSRPEMTPHRPDCTQPTPAVARPGRAVYDASPPDREGRP